MLRDWVLVRTQYTVAAVINTGPGLAFIMVIVSVSYLPFWLLAFTLDQAMFL